MGQGGAAISCAWARYPCCSYNHDKDILAVVLQYPSEGGASETCAWARYPYFRVTEL